MLEFELPWVFLLLPLPLVVYFLLPPASITSSALLKVPFFQQVQALSIENQHRASYRSYRFAFVSILWILLLSATARPVWLGEDIVLPAEGRDLMLAVDLSGSMKRPDMTLNGEAVDRLTIIKIVLRDFIARRAGDRLGLILFGTQAYLQTPLTFDLATLEQFLLEAEIGLAGDATAIGDAIGLAIKRLSDRPSSSRVLILLTDGSNTAGAIEPLQAARLAKQKQLKIYTVGVGADQMETPGIFGSSFFSQTINPSADLDEATLREIAELTGGQYFRAKSTQDLANIYQELDRLEPIESDSLSFSPKRSLFHYPLALAFALSLAYAFSMLLKSWWQRSRYNKNNTEDSHVG